MPKYMWKVSYSVDGIRGLMKQGAADRAAQIGEITAANGGKLEGFYFAFGDTDAYVISEMPSDTSAAAIALAVAASGAASIETVKLLTPAEMDEARGVQTGYKAPGA
jgi:uncharacterized protein with GYD domain